MRRPLLILSLAATIAASCTTTGASPSAPVPATPLRSIETKVSEPLRLREPIMGVMIGMIDFSSWGVFRVATLQRPPTDGEWLAAGLASLNLIGSSTLITLPGTGDNDAAWTAQVEWKSYATEMQAASMAVSSAVRHRNANELSSASDRLARACQACHTQYRPELPQIAMTRLASLPAGTTQGIR